MVKDNFEKFSTFWHEEISKIENEVLDTRGVRLIYLSFDISKNTLIISMPASEFTFEMQLEIELLESKLIRVLETARTKYILQSRSLWVRIIESIAGMIMRVPKPTGISKKVIKCKRLEDWPFVCFRTFPWFFHIIRYSVLYGLSLFGHVAALDRKSDG